MVEVQLVSDSVEREPKRGLIHHQLAPAEGVSVLQQCLFSGILYSTLLDTQVIMAILKIAKIEFSANLDVLDQCLSICLSVCLKTQTNLLKNNTMYNDAQLKC